MTVAQVKTHIFNSFPLKPFFCIIQHLFLNIRKNKFSFFNLTGNFAAEISGSRTDFHHGHVVFQFKPFDQLPGGKKDIPEWNEQCECHLVRKDTFGGKPAHDIRLAFVCHNLSYNRKTNVFTAEFQSTGIKISLSEFSL